MCVCIVSLEIEPVRCQFSPIQVKSGNSMRRIIYRNLAILRREEVSFSFIEKAQKEKTNRTKGRKKKCTRCDDTTMIV